MATQVFVVHFVVAFENFEERGNVDFLAFYEEDLPTENGKKSQVPFVY